MRTHAISKRVLSVVLALMLVLGMLPVMAMAADTTTIYFTNDGPWKTVKIYYWADGYNPIGWPGSSMKLVEGNIYSFDVPAGCTKVIFNNGNGGSSNQTADLGMPTDGTNMYTYSTGKWTTYSPAATCEHVWGAANITVAPTCNGKGEATYTCGKCGSSYTDSVDALGHSYADGVCTVCGVGESIEIFFENTAGWANVNAYYWCDGGNLTSWPGEAMSPVEGAIWSYTLPGDAQYIIFNDGSTQTDNLTIPADKDLYVYGADWTNYEPDNCYHVWDEGTVITPSSCQSEGEISFTCTLCGNSTSDVIPISGHSYVDGICSVCGEAKTYYLVGYINGADYGINDDWESLGEYKFVDGTLVTSFDIDSYIFIKTGDNASWYMADAYCTDTTCTFNEGGSEKMLVPGGVELTFTLVENEDLSLTLSYTTGAPACQHPNHGDDGICTDCGAAVEHTFENGTCTICGLVKEPVAVGDYYVAGTINGWNQKDEAYKMSIVDDLFVLELTIGAGVTEFKVTDGTWDNAWPASNYLINAAQECTITITFNPETSEITVTGYEEAPSKYYLHGYINGADIYGEEFLFVDGTLTTTFDQDSYVYICTDGGIQYMAEAFITEPSGKFVIGGGEKMFVPAGEVTFTLVENEDDSLTLSYGTAAAGFGVSGTITSFGGSDEITVELIQDGVAVYSTVAAADGAYAIANVAGGSYTLKITKLNHVALELDITVEADVAQDAKICLIGDATGDGKVNMKDWTVLYNHISETSTLEGYKLACADASNDGKVNMKDWTRLYNHISEVTPLW